ncbi:hypothetical protein B484DRAFT_16195 [Ochromonadaceae sp. CCMP2298]|nr:hypothetical protein B484DRAFT_16195 [Ochromonadaceae sp. CCMP2298]
MATHMGEATLGSLPGCTLELVVGYLGKLSDVPALAGTCNFWQSFIYSLDGLWQQQPVDMCLQPACFGCGRTVINEQTATRLLRCTSMKCARMHLSISRMPSVLAAMFCRNTVSKLHLRFTPDTAMHPFFGTGVTQPSLRCLTIFAWPHIQTKEMYNSGGDCSSSSSRDGSSSSRDSSSSSSSQSPFSCFLRSTGSNLQSLKLMESCPPDVFAAVGAYCPQLTRLTVEGPQCAGSLQDLLQMQSASLRHLCLKGTGMKLAGKLALPNLESLVFLNDNDESVEEAPPHTEAEVLAAVRSLSQDLRSLELRVYSKLVNCTLAAIAECLPALVCLKVFVADAKFEAQEEDDAGPSDVDVASVLLLSKGCPRLETLEISGGLVGFEAPAFTALFDCLGHQLRSLKLIYDDDVVDLLQALLSRSSMVLEQLVFFENASEIAHLLSGDRDRWWAMEDKLQGLAEQFPSVSINLLDVWW